MPDNGPSECFTRPLTHPIPSLGPSPTPPPRSAPLQPLTLCPHIYSEELISWVRQQLQLDPPLHEAFTTLLGRLGVPAELVCFEEFKKVHKLQV